MCMCIYIYIQRERERKRERKRERFMYLYDTASGNYSDKSTHGSKYYKSLLICFPSRKRQPYTDQVIAASSTT